MQSSVGESSGRAVTLTGAVRRQIRFFGGGVVEDDSFWNPRGPGGIVINIDLEASEGPVNFVLKELIVRPLRGNR